MGTLTLSGVLKRPISGDVVPNARITFDAIATGSVVLKGVSSSCKTASDGNYSVALEYGSYAIQVSWAGQVQQYGTVSIDSTTPMGSLNDLLMQEVMESQLTPEIILEFRQLEQEMQEDLAQMEGLNDQASDSATSATASATAAAVSETNCAASEDASAASAVAAALSEANSSASEEASAASAAAAQTSETNSAISEDASSASAVAAQTSEANSAISEDASATSAASAKASETNAAASEVASAASATAAKTSETNAAASKEASTNSETNAKNARDAAEEYAQEAKSAASKVTNPLTDQGQWTIQAGYPGTPDVASIWQITDGGADPVNSDIIWDPGDMLVYLATTGTWCRVLGQQVVAGEPVPLRIDADIILNVGAGLQIVTSGTTAVDVARLDADNNLVLGDNSVPGICLSAAEPTNMFVLVSDGNGGFTKSRIYSEAFPPPQAESPVLSVNDATGAVVITLDSLGAGTAATLDVQTSKDDVTAGRVLINGGALAVRTSTAKASGGTVASANSLPVNSVSFVYDSATEGPGISGSLLSFSGLQQTYPIQITASYSGAGERIKFRTCNGDAAQAWNPWYEFYHTGHKPTAGDVGAVPTSRNVNGHALSADINVTSQDIFNTQSIGIGTNQNLNSYQTPGIYYQPANANTSAALNYPENNAGTLMVLKNAGVTQVYYVYNSSRIWSRSIYSTGAWTPWAREYNTLNKPTAGDIGAYTKSESDAKFIQGIQLGAQGTYMPAGNEVSWTYDAPTGCVLTGIVVQDTGEHSADNIGGVHYQPVQENVNGTYKTIAG